MAPKHLHYFRCPCCKERLEFDVRTNAVRQPENLGAEGFDALIADQKQAAERLERSFDGARDSQARERERLDRLFREAQRDSADDDSKPGNPFDLD